MEDLDFSLDAMYDQPGIIVTTPVADQYGTVYVSVEEAARRTGVSRRAIEAQLRTRSSLPSRGMRFHFVE
jgi:hypothetical protein